MKTQNALVILCLLCIFSPILQAQKTIHSVILIVKIEGTEKPVVGAKVYLPNYKMLTGNNVSSTGTQGTADLKLEAGTYEVWIRSENDTLESTSKSFVVEGIVGTQTVTIKLKPLLLKYDLNINVERERKGIPIKDAQIKIERISSGISDSSGYVFKKGLDINQCIEITATHPEYENGKVCFCPDVNARNQNATIQLIKSHFEVRINVFKDNDKKVKLKGAQVKFYGYKNEKDEKNEYDAVTDQDGKVIFRKIRNGYKKIEVFLEGYIPQTQFKEVGIKEDKDRVNEFDVYLKEIPDNSFVVSGSLLDENGQPLGGASLTLSLLSKSLETKTNENGRFEFKGIAKEGFGPDYKFSIDANHEYFKPILIQNRKITLQEGERRKIEIALKANITDRKFREKLIVINSSEFSKEDITCSCILKKRKKSDCVFKINQTNAATEIRLVLPVYIKKYKKVFFKIENPLFRKSKKRIRRKKLENDEVINIKLKKKR